MGRAGWLRYLRGVEDLAAMTLTALLWSIIGPAVSGEEGLTLQDSRSLAALGPLNPHVNEEGPKKRVEGTRTISPLINRLWVYRGWLA